MKNHLLFESRTPLSVGAAFPEFRQARRLRALAMQLLVPELRHQVRPDGCHAGQSIAYYLQVMRKYLCARTVLESPGPEVPDRYARAPTSFVSVA